MKVDNPKLLIDFVKHLYEIHCDLYGFNVNVRNSCEGPDRCQRWLDAVLPEEIHTAEIPLPAELRDIK